MGEKLLSSHYDHFMRCRAKGIWVNALNGGWYHDCSVKAWGEYMNRMPLVVISYIKLRIFNETGKPLAKIDLRAMQLT